jgi:outer membrane receptor protein involved in Fe transport
MTPATLTVVVRLLLALVPAAFVPARGAFAQEVGTVTGTVTEAGSGRPLIGIAVSLPGTRMTVETAGDGRYELTRVPLGPHVLEFRWFGRASRIVEITVRANAPQTLDMVLDPAPIRLGEIVVIAASRQRGQLPELLADLPGVSAPQSGIHEYNVNARGFNSMLNRRVLVLVDGRDVSLPILGIQEWAALTSLPEGSRIEMMRGPGSALYGPNAFSGVINIVTPTVREDRGTRLHLAGGELSTLTGDVSRAWVAPNLRWGYRVRGGYYRSAIWERSRTALGDMGREYGRAGQLDSVRTPPPGFEVIPLRGQTKATPFGLPGAAVGDLDPISTTFGEARVDSYSEDGSVLTLEGGTSYVQNGIFTSGLGRSQVYSAHRPWARVAWASDDLYVTGYYTGRSSGDQLSLASGANQLETSSTLHVEGQIDRTSFANRLRYILGYSARTTKVDSRGTLFRLSDDGRRDQFFALFGQVRLNVIPKLDLVLAGRVDDGTLHEGQFSPKAALVFTPRDETALRVTYNRAFLTPSPLLLFLSVPAGPPLDLAALERGLRQSALGPALVGVPTGALFTNSGAVPLLALGNEELAVERVESWELGFKGQFGRVFASVDAYMSILTDFVTNVLPGANPAYPAWTAPVQVPPAFRSVLEGLIRSTVGTGLTRLQDGTTAFVLSLGNAGKAEERGIDASLGIDVSSRVRLEANYSAFGSEVQQSTFVPGDSILPNTPRQRASLSASYRDEEKLSMRIGLTATEAFEWASGVYRGRIPSSQAVDISAAHALGKSLRLSVVGTNVFDQRRYHIYGGSIVGRRVLAGLTWEP